MDETKNLIIETTSGFVCSIEEDAMDDMELFDDLMQMENPDAAQPVRMKATVNVFRKILGARQEKALEKHLRERDGKVKFSAFYRELNEVFMQLQKSKKKS